MNFKILKFPIEQLNKENHSINERFSHPAYVKKLPRDIEFLCDISIYEKKFELELKSGNRYWFDFSDFFGKAIFNTEKLFIKYSNDVLQEITIIGVEMFKVKRTNYIKLIFEKDLPF